MARHWHALTAIGIAVAQPGGWQPDELAAFTTGRAAPDLARLRPQVETGPLAGLASATAQAMAVADELCWDSLSRGDAAAFTVQAMILFELRQRPAAA